MRAKRANQQSNGESSYHGNPEQTSGKENGAGLSSLVRTSHFPPIRVLSVC